MKTLKYKKHFIAKFFREYFDLSQNKEDEKLTVETIRNGVEFKGANLWILIFATYIASLGLNVNSTAVIIGAMLISPLMGPIMGVGMAVGTNDFELMKRSLKSYFIATVFSVTTATLYFSFTPLDDVQSELLARTSPTIYDVFIALFGGLAGIVACATKEKGNVIPGVAIATALMPPLCTAGFGLATGNMMYFLGAFYLYFINSVFISFATYIGIRVMHFEKKQFIDKAREQIVRKYIVIITVLTICPAIYLTYNIVKETIYNSAVKQFVSQELVFPDTQILSYESSYTKKEIKAIVLGKEITEDVIHAIQQKLKNYNLMDTKLLIYQGINNDNVDITNIKKMVLEDFYENSEQKIEKQKHTIDSLNHMLEMYTRSGQADEKLANEVKALFTNVQTVALARSVRVSTDSVARDTLTFAIIKSEESIEKEELERMSLWLKARTGAKTMKVLIE